MSWLLKVRSQRRNVFYIPLLHASFYSLRRTTAIYIICITLRTLTDIQAAFPFRCTQ